MTDETHADAPYTVLSLASGEKLKIQGVWEAARIATDEAERNGHWVYVSVHLPNGGHEKRAVRADRIETIGPIAANRWPDTRQTADALLACIGQDYAVTA